MSNTTVAENDFNKVLDNVFQASREPGDGRPRRFAQLAQTIETARNNEPEVFVATPHLAAERLSAIYSLDEAGDEAGDEPANTPRTAQADLNQHIAQGETAFADTTFMEQTELGMPDAPSVPTLPGDAKDALGYVDQLSIDALHELRRKLALAYHPDRNAPELHAAATEQMTLVNRIIDDAVSARRLADQRQPARKPGFRTASNK